MTSTPSPDRSPAAWWWRRARGDAVCWGLARDPDGVESYVGAAAGWLLRIPAPWGYKAGAGRELAELGVREVAVDAGGAWAPLTGDRRDADRLWERARRVLVVDGDRGPPPREEFLDVFLSYRDSDADLARALARALRDAGLRVWFDEWDLPAERPRPLESYLRSALKRTALVVQLDDFRSVLDERPVPSGPGFNLFGEQERWFQYERELALLGLPTDICRLSREQLRDDWDRELAHLLELIRSGAAARADAISTRVWTDETDDRRGDDPDGDDAVDDACP